MFQLINKSLLFLIPLLFQNYNTKDFLPSLLQIQQIFHDSLRTLVWLLLLRSYPIMIIISLFLHQHNTAISITPY